VPVFTTSGALGVFFLVLIFSDDYDVGLDLDVFVECGFAVPPAALELDVFVQPEFGLSHKNLLVLNTGKLTSWRFLRKRF
jgi:hypothetical protein